MDHEKDNQLLFDLIYRVRELDRELEKANSKIHKLEKALNYKKIAKYVNKYFGKQAEKTIEYNETTWSDLEEYLGI